MIPLNTSILSFLFPSIAGYNYFRKVKNNPMLRNCQEKKFFLNVHSRKNNFDIHGIL